MVKFSNVNQGLDYARSSRDVRISIILKQPSYYTTCGIINYELNHIRRPNVIYYTNDNLGNEINAFLLQITTLCSNKHVSLHDEAIMFASGLHVIFVDPSYRILNLDLF
jgi:hypothetical protein